MIEFFLHIQQLLFQFKQDYKRLITKLSFILIIFCCTAPTSIVAQTPEQVKAESESIQYPDLATELIAMRDTDQKLRIKWGGMIRKDKINSKRYKELSQQLLEADRANTARMKEIIAQYGWPTFDMVGEKGGRSAWILAQHADRDPFFQADCLALMEKALSEDQVYPKNYAYLYDRVQVAFGEKQLYATQSTSNNGLWEGHFQPIADESKVQERREAMGIMLHVEEYATSMGFSYTVPSEAEAIQRADSLIRAHQTHQAMGMEAIKREDWETAALHLRLATQCNGSVIDEDYFQLARALSLSKDSDAKRAFFLLMKATVLGHEAISTFGTDPDFMYLKTLNPHGWEDLMRLVGIAEQRKPNEY